MFLFLCACVEEKELASYTEPLPYEYEAEVASPSIDVLALEQETNEAIALIRSYHSRSIMNSYTQVLGYADAQCPSRYELNGNAFWYGYCTSSQGLSFDGYLFYNTYEETDLFGDGTLWDAQILSGSSSLYQSSLGKTWYGGNVYLAEGINSDGAEVFLSAIQGSFLIQDAQEDWFQEGWAPSLTMYGVRYDLPTEAANALVVQGSVPFQGEHIGALAFTDLIIYDQIFGYSCPQEPLGMLSIRSKEGIWIDVSFDVEADWSVSGVCDGCGVGTTESGDVYEICLDFAPLLDWEENPW